MNCLLKYAEFFGFSRITQKVAEEVKYGFVKSLLEKMKLWPVEHFWLTDLEKKWAKSVQLVRVSFFRSDFLQNPYFS